MFSAREDHVHPKDTETVTETVQPLLSPKADKSTLVGVVFAHHEEVAVADWVVDGSAVKADVTVAGLSATSVVQVLPAVLTYTAYDALGITVKTVGDGTLTLSANSAPASDVKINILYTKPTVFPAS